MTKKDRREYGTGALYQRSTDGRWIGVVAETWNADGDRKRITVTGKGCQPQCAPRCPHRAAIKRKMERRKDELTRGESASARATVKQWAETYLDMRKRDLSPKGYNAAASPIRKWVIPTIGRRRLADLTPADLRAITDAQRNAGRKAATAAATHRATLTMLRAAIREGHPVPPRILETKAPRAEKSDRAAMTVEEGLACLRQAATMPNGARWLFTLLYGARQGEALGLTWDAVDLDAGTFGEVVIEWQLQPLPYNKPRDRKSGFRVPDGYEARHLVDSYHLVRPKTRTGYRVAPLLAPVRDALADWRDRAPGNQWGLVWPEPDGRPMNDKHDRAEWWALQQAAGVHHPTRMTKDDDGKPVPAPYHIHECRNFAATMLLEAGVDPYVVTTLLGHSSIVMSQAYRTVRREPLLDALQRVGERLQLGQ